MAEYFDYAAATPLSPAVLKAMEPYYSQEFYNPSAIYLAGQAIRHKINESRQQIASSLGAKSSEIIFTAGGTEANNLAIFGVATNSSNHIIVSAVEHLSVLEPAKKQGASVVSVDSTGRINLEHLRRLITPDTILLSVGLVNNEIGTIQDLRPVRDIINSELARRRQASDHTPLYLHSDACQATNFIDINVTRLGLDLMTVNSGKIYGPKQMGCLYVKSGITLNPLILGGKQEKNLRSGTENVAAIMGMAQAVSDAQSKAQNSVKTLAPLQKLLHDELVKIPGVTLNGPKLNRRIVNNLNICVANYDNERLMMELDERGFMVATGSACSASSDEPSHVLTAIGLNDESIRSSIRISLGKSSNEHNCQQLAAAIKEIVAKN